MHSPCGYYLFLLLAEPKFELHFARLVGCAAAGFLGIIIRWHTDWVLVMGTDGVRASVGCISRHQPLVAPVCAVRGDSAEISHHNQYHLPSCSTQLSLGTSHLHLGSKVFELVCISAQSLMIGASIVDQVLLPCSACKEECVSLASLQGGDSVLTFPTGAICQVGTIWARGLYALERSLASNEKHAAVYGNAIASGLQVSLQQGQARFCDWLVLPLIIHMQAELLEAKESLSTANHTIICSSNAENRSESAHTCTARLVDLILSELRGCLRIDG